MDAKHSDQILKALVGAFVWVASSDGGVDENEWTKYGHVIVGSPFASQFNQEDIGRYFKEYVSLFANDFDQAMQLTKKNLAEFREQKNVSEEIIRIGRAAMVGDGHVSESEEVTLNTIAELLDLKGQA